MAKNSLYTRSRAGTGAGTGTRRFSKTLPNTKDRKGPIIAKFTTKERLALAKEGKYFIYKLPSYRSTNYLDRELAVKNFLIAEDFEYDEVYTSIELA